MRIEKDRADKLAQYSAGLEGELINIKSGRDTKLKELIFNQSDHIKIAQMSTQIRDQNEKIELTNEKLSQILDLLSGQTGASNTAARVGTAGATSEVVNTKRPVSDVNINEGNL